MSLADYRLQLQKLVLIPSGSSGLLQLTPRQGTYPVVHGSGSL